MIDGQEKQNSLFDGGKMFGNKTFALELSPSSVSNNDMDDRKIKQTNNWSIYLTLHFHPAVV